MKKKLLFLAIVNVFACKTFSQEIDNSYRKFPVFNFQKITEKIFDARMIQKEVFVWKPTYADLFNFGYNVSDDGNCYTRLDTAMTYTAKGEKFYLLAYKTVGRTKTGEKDCHSCSPNISMALFKEEADKSYTLENFNKTFTSFGGFGQSGKYSLQKVGPDHLSLVLEYGYMGQGQFTSMRDYYLLDTTRFLAPIFSFTKEEGDNNTGENEMVTAQTAPVPNHEYYDFFLTTKKNGKILPKKEHYTFSYESNTYIKAK